MRELVAGGFAGRIRISALAEPSSQCDREVIRCHVNYTLGGRIDLCIPSTGDRCSVCSWEHPFCLFDNVHIHMLCGGGSYREFWVVEGRRTDQIPAFG